MSTQSEPADGIALSVSPEGLVHVRPDAAATPLAPRIAEAFARGVAEGIFHLGAVEIATDLPAEFAFFRELARRFVTQLCALPDLEQNRGDLAVAPPDAADLDALVGSAPPMEGAEYLSRDALALLWSALEAVASNELRAFRGSAQQWLQSKNALWNLVGRVCFHLAENKRNPDAPFAFLATYTSRVSSQARVQHVPLGRALAEYSGASNRAALLALLTPVQQAASESAWLKRIVDSGDVYRPTALSAAEAYGFLQDVPHFETAGIVVRLPDWWKASKPPRPQVSVSVGKRPPSALGLDAMLDFTVSTTLDGEALSRAELDELMAGDDGLVLLKGRWVEVDRAKLRAVLEHWKSAREAARDGVSFREAMRWLSGAPIESGDTAASLQPEREWSAVAAGPWLDEVLAGLRDPDRLGTADPGDGLKATLRPYQSHGVRWLWWLYNLGLGACLADDMGLGKTVQVLALLLLIKKRRPSHANILVVPASLLANWQSEIERFAPSLRFVIAHPSAMTSAQLAGFDVTSLASTDLVITTYGSLHRLAWIAATQWNLVVLDEAQAIKNPSALQTRAAKSLKGASRVVLTGTPVENRLGDLWSLFDFACPGLLGSAKAFTAYTRRLANDGATGYAPLRALVRPYILRRLKTDRRVIADLPDKTEMLAYCALTKRQAALYQKSVDALAEQLEKLDGIERRGVVLAFMMRLKQICNHPSQWLGDGSYDPDDSGKFDRLRSLCDEIASRQERALVFTQFREMTDPLAKFLRGVFGREGLVLHGETPVKKRGAMVKEFQQPDGPPFFVLSVKAGGTGLNLTAASHVIHFDRWWNPAVENQATDRAFRIGQKKNVLVHKFVCKGTVEEKIDALIESKRALSAELIDGAGGEVKLTEMNNDELLKLVALDLRSALDDM